MDVAAASTALVSARRRLSRLRWPTVVSAAALLVLAAHPLRWLVGTWTDPSYQSEGGWLALGIAVLLARSVASGAAQPDPAAAARAWRLLLATATVRVAGHLAGVDTIGALALVVDLGALAVALGVDRRPFALGPLAVACLGTLALPVENVLQRLAGHPLQLAAAMLAEAVLRPLHPALVREGVLLLHPGVELAVDLPCSGARGLTLLSGVALAFWCRRRVQAPQLAWGVLAVAGGALFANALRVIVLFEGGLAGVPLHDEPAHSVLGAGVLAIAALPAFALGSRLPVRRARWQRPFGVAAPAAPVSLPPAGVALVLACAAAMVLLAPEKPLDVSRPPPGRRLPETIGAATGSPLAISSLERRYYERYGGSVQKRVYRDDAGLTHTVLLVRTGAPLRHLHGPDRCLIGAGHAVTRVGVRRGATPSVVYRSVAPDGRVWRVETSFVNDAGESAVSVSEVLWRWLAAPRPWSLVERITPWAACLTDPARCRDFDTALFAALDLPSPAPAPLPDPPSRKDTP